VAAPLAVVAVAAAVARDSTANLSDEPLSLVAIFEVCYKTIT